MNAEAYIRRELLLWSNWNELGDDRYIAKDHHYQFLQGREFTDDDFFDIEDGLLFKDEILKLANDLENNLIRNGRAYFKDYEIAIDNYNGSVFFEDVTCQINYEHKTTDAELFLREVYFREENGEILQAILAF